LLSFLSCILTPDPLTCGDIVKLDSQQQIVIAT